MRRMRMQPRLVWPLLLSLLGFAPLRARAEDAADEVAATVAAIDALVRAAEVTDSSPGCAVMVCGPQGVLFAKGYGRAGTRDRSGRVVGMNARAALVMGGILGALGVALGAYHAHGLEAFLQRVAAPEQVGPRMARAHTAVLFQLFHALALVALAAVAFQRPSRLLAAAAWLFSLGIALFSGGLYLEVFTGTFGHWAIVPAGGLAWIAGWVLLAAHGLTSWRGSMPGGPRA
jgi:uncharacterized membrane protein YgdD (TMEM256/DUF423 family)